MSEKSIKTKIIILSQMRDAIYQVSPHKIFRSPQHKQECFNAIVEALENLEDELSELQANEEQQAAWTIKAENPPKKNAA